MVCLASTLPLLVSSSINLNLINIVIINIVIIIFKHENYVKLTTEGYCVKCKVRRSMKDEKRVRAKDGRSGISGICTVCGGKMFQMVGKTKVPSRQRSKKVGKVKIKGKSKRK